MLLVFASPVKGRRYRLAEWRVVPEQREPERFPAWLFWLGLLLGISWFLRAERRVRLPDVASASRPI
jgi:hypothetical protein